MGAITLFQIIFWVITNLPDIIKLIRAIVELIKEMKNKPLAKEVQAELVQAVQYYQKTKDKRPLEKLLCRLKGTCEVPPK